MSAVQNENAPKSGRSKKILWLTAGLVLVGGGAAFAYWTVGGAGTGSAATGTTSNILPVQTTTVTDMHPGDTAQALSGNFTNGDEGPVYVGTVTASISSVIKAAPGISGPAPTGTCDASDYTLDGAVMTVDAEVPVGFKQGSWSGATIKFNDKPTNQDACKGAIVNLAYTIG
ncbi:hypothetical protein [Arthrobacter sp.]|uniref:hypothetical protein n=1 Tax=Arthrobacter sp. TaxID=1667 RepID=UPI0026DF6636|nr:hypothetical protein [Arthrobacter sp.]MDO5753418.1 hypothetical protein [Arthrobacter sp.]